MEMPGSERKEMSMYAYFSHHKCATAWAENIIRNICQLLGLRLEVLWRPEKLPNNWENTEFFRNRNIRCAPEDWQGIDFFFHTNAERSLIEKLRDVDYRGVHVIRDPRDILVSGYFSHLKSHVSSPDVNPWMIEHRQRLKKVSKEDGLSLEIDYCETFFERLATWDFSNPRIYETRFEVLTANAFDEFRKIFDFVGLPITNISVLFDLSLLRVPLRTALQRFGFKTANNEIPQIVFKYILHRNSFKSKASRKKGTEDRSSHYRKGVQGDWVNHLKGKNKDKFKERYGQLLIDLGYTQDFNW
jgi:hypothetical protein